MKILDNFVDNLERKLDALASYSYLLLLVDLLKRKLQHVGHIQITLWVSKSSGSTGVTHFQP